MINILQTELYRLKKSALFWTLLGVCAGLPLLGLLFEISVAATTEGMWEILGELEITNSSLSGLASLMSNPALFALICISIFLSREFSGGTIRNMLISNKSRTEIYFCFLTVALSVSVAYLLASFASIMIFNATVFGFGNLNAGQAVAACFTSLAMGVISIVLVTTMMCMFLFVSRKLSHTLAWPLVICLFAPQILALVIELLSLARILAGGEFTFAELSWIPLYNISLYDASAIDGTLIGKIAMYNIPLSALFVYLGWMSFQKADLK